MKSTHHTSQLQHFLVHIIDGESHRVVNGLVQQVALCPGYIQHDDPHVSSAARFSGEIPCVHSQKIDRIFCKSAAADGGLPLRSKPNQRLERE